MLPNSWTRRWVLRCWWRCRSSTKKIGFNRSGLYWSMAVKTMAGDMCRKDTMMPLVKLYLCLSSRPPQPCVQEKTRMDWISTTTSVPCCSSCLGVVCLLLFMFSDNFSPFAPVLRPHTKLFVTFRHRHGTAYASDWNPSRPHAQNTARLTDTCTLHTLQLPGINAEEACATYKRPCRQPIKVSTSRNNCWGFNQG